VDFNIARRIHHNSLAHDLVAAYSINTKSPARLEVFSNESRLSRKLRVANGDLQDSGLQGWLSLFEKG
jgi:hypothetical protein